MKVFIHIGCDKCGSTAIQTSLYENRDVLREHGIYLPRNGLGRHNGHAKCFRDESGQIFSDLVKELKAVENDYSTAIISWEGIHFISEEDLDRRYSPLRHFDAQAVYYVRDQAEIVQSGILQKLKESDCGLLFEMNTPPTRNYFDTAERWSNFLRNKTQVSLFDRRSFIDGDITHDFFIRVGMKDLSGLSPLKKELNQSLSYESASILAMLDRSFIFKDGARQSFVNTLLYTQNDFQLSKFFLSEDDVSAIREHYQENNCLLQSSYSVGPINSQSACWRDTTTLPEIHTELFARTIKLFDVPVLKNMQYQGKQLRKILSAGWYPAKHWGAWSNNLNSTIRFRFSDELLENTKSKSKQILIEIEGRYINGTRKSTQIKINGSSTQRVDLRSYKLSLDIDNLQPDNIVEINLTHEPPPSQESTERHKNQPFHFGIKQLSVIIRNDS